MSHMEVVNSLLGWVAVADIVVAAFSLVFLYSCLQHQKASSWKEILLCFAGRCHWLRNREALRSRQRRSRNQNGNVQEDLRRGQAYDETYLSHLESQGVDTGR